MKQKTTTKHGMHLGIFLGVLLLGGCMFSGKSPSVGQTGSSRVASVARVYLPPNGGLTIRPPQKMAAVYALWQPLTAKERQRIATRTQRTHSAENYNFAAITDKDIQQFVPETERAAVHEYLQRLTVRHIGVTRKAMERAAQHMPVIQATLRRKGLPQELACLPLVESAFESQAVSHAGAAGLWQLMPATARRFGLTVTDALDERFDPVKSTEAALSYLAVLYGHFNDWGLAIAAYNCGEGTMQRVLRACNVSTLAEVTVLCRSDTPPSPRLADETLRFVPQFAAAVVVMSQSQQFGLADRNLVQLSGQMLQSRIAMPPRESRQSGAPMRQESQEHQIEAALLPQMQTDHQPVPQKASGAGTSGLRPMKRIPKEIPSKTL